MNTIITLNWNTTDLLIGMFESACKNANKKFKTIIVDNGSTQTEYDKLVSYFENKQNEHKEKKSTIDFMGNVFEYQNKHFDVILKRLPKNLGFAAGNNVGLSFIKEEGFVFFINSDIVVDEKDWDFKFEEVFNLENNIAIVGVAYHPLKWSKDGKFQIQKISNVPVESESVQGAFFSIPFEILQTIKSKDGFWFDENFKFAHYEETDLCFRVIDLGYKCYWFPLLHKHLHDSSATKKNGYNLSDEIKNIDDFKKNSEKNRQLLYNKHLIFFRTK